MMFDIKKFMLWICILFLIGASGTSVYFYSQWKKAINNPNTLAEEDIRVVVAEVGMYMELPQGEEPTMATVIDREKLQDQEFFAKSQNGDRVLIYANARKAILYRPSTKKIIEVAPIFFNESAQETPTQNTTTPTPVAPSTDNGATQPTSE